MRLFPPVPLVMRRLQNDLDFGEYFVSAFEMSNAQRIFSPDAKIEKNTIILRPSESVAEGTTVPAGVGINISPYIIQRNA